MEMTTLGLTFEDVYKEVSNYLGLGLAPTGGNLALTKKYVNDGYRIFLMGTDPRTQRVFQWSFLAPAATLDVWAATSGACTDLTYDSGTGKTAITNTSATDTFYPSMVGHEITFAATGNSYTITDYVDATQVKVATDITATESSTDGYSVLANGTYSLPDDFAAVIDDFTYDAAGPLIKLQPRSPQFIRQLFAGGGSVSGPPQCYAIQPRAFEAVAGQRYEALVWPVSGSHYRLHYRYRVEPAELSADEDYPMGGPQHAQTILQAALMVAEQRHNDTVGPHTNAFEKLMAASIDLDAANKPANLSACEDGNPLAGLARRTNNVTYS